MNKLLITMAGTILVVAILAMPMRAEGDTPEIVTMHAPILTFHPDEGSQCCYPSDAEEAYLKLCCYLYYPTPFCGEPLDPIYCGVSLKWPTTLIPNTPCYFQIAEGPQGGVPCNVTRIKYWFWYNFNDFPEGPIWGSHPGDWESVEVVLVNGNVHVYLLSSHGDECIPGGCIPVWPQEAILENGHIKVWAGNGSHANYPSPNSAVYCDEELGVYFCDQIANSDSVWYTMDNLKAITATNFADYTGQWGDPVSPVVRPLEHKIPYYKIWVYTGDVYEGATDADVYITLYGTGGASPELELDNYENNFEQGCVDTFSPGTDTEFGELQQIHIRHDDSGSEPGWFLNKVVVENQQNNKRWTFNCYRWLATDEDDGEIERTLDAVVEHSLYFGSDINLCNETYAAGYILQFLPGVTISGTCCTGGYIRFVGEPSANTRLFSTEGEITAGIMIPSGEIRLYNNGSIRFH